MNFHRNHIMAFGLFLTGMAAQLGGLKDWHDAITPVFCAGVALNVGSILIAAATDSLFKGKDNESGNSTPPNP